MKNFNRYVDVLQILIRYLNLHISQKHYQYRVSPRNRLFPKQMLRPLRSEKIFMIWQSRASCKYRELILVLMRAEFDDMIRSNTKKSFKSWMHWEGRFLLGWRIKETTKLLIERLVKFDDLIIMHRSNCICVESPHIGVGSDTIKNLTTHLHCPG